MNATLTGNVELDREIFALDELRGAHDGVIPQWMLFNDDSAGRTLTFEQDGKRYGLFVPFDSDDRKFAWLLAQALDALIFQRMKNLGWTVERYRAFRQGLQ
mgnify:CR=1 FL=1